MKKRLFILIAIILIVPVSTIFADENTNTQNQNVTVNINMDDIKSAAGLTSGITDIRTTPTFGMGLSTPLIGTNHDVYRNGEKYTDKVTGFNIMLGYTWRNYLGNGLPVKGGAFYTELFTMAFIVPMVGAGYDYRFNESFVVGVGFPDILHGSISF